VHLRDPQDEMLYTPGNDPFLLIAGGIGITPMISLLRYAAFIHASRSIHLLYANPSKASEAYRDELDHYTTQNPLTITRFYSDEGHSIQEHDVLLFVAKSPQPYVYIAGPESMTRGLRSAAIAAGTRESRVQVTDFSGYAGTAGFE
jgi:ferredoxin-NADP reductase